MGNTQKTSSINLLPDKFLLIWSCLQTSGYRIVPCFMVGWKPWNLDSILLYWQHLFLRECLTFHTNQYPQNNTLYITQNLLQFLWQLLNLPPPPQSNLSELFTMTMPQMLIFALMFVYCTIVKYMYMQYLMAFVAMYPCQVNVPKYIQKLKDSNGQDTSSKWF